MLIWWHPTTMSHYEFPSRFRSLYDRAVALYTGGQRGADTYFGEADLAYLSANGLTAQHLYDYAEDDQNSGEPGFESALGIELVRRDYFLNVQCGNPSSTVLDEATMPTKSDSVRGIDWLPRILPKTKAKLRGELPASLMYPCGGDRRFFKEHGILPSEFLNLVWRHLDNDEAVIDWVVARTGK